MGSYLSDRRKELGKTQKEIAEYVGVSEATVSRWESGDIANMRRDKIKKYAEILETSTALIMGWQDGPALLEAIREIDANHKKAAELLGWGVTITGEDLIYREVIGNRPVQDQIALLTTLYQLNLRGEPADKNVRTLRILAELVSVMTPEDQDKLVAFAEFTEAEGRKRQGLPPVMHQYQTEEK